ncbi:hypothetical protein VQ7734_02268 [Vibrio quintilis]|uniref:Uncharacterized protein n=1 Tax=Vibrio quintilis TaxID=1117707 RepID=A0A1M7YV12_9VIBR|nr:hypothetical protein VQ7734_02268 [Vibrio quintilis]
MFVMFYFNFQGHFCVGFSGRTRQARGISKPGCDSQKVSLLIIMKQNLILSVYHAVF